MLGTRATRAAGLTHEQRPVPPAKRRRQAQPQFQAPVSSLLEMEQIRADYYAKMAQFNDTVRYLALTTIPPLLGSTQFYKDA